ncbi:hypothetical protein [Tenacibaculum xiamenense]|uniref:hypothetical protein n=1 Tax=Tenacibaculum xiamenense TaxID=1261553 RepID=UPI0038965AD7
MKNNYVSLGLIFGAGIGISIGVLTDNLPIFLSIGTGAGLALGAGLEAYAKGKKRDCQTKKTNN